MMNAWAVKASVDGTHRLGRDAPGAQALDVAEAVAADRGHHHRLAAEGGEVVGDVAGAAAEFAAQPGHQERDVQDVQLLRQDLVGEPAGKGGDAVERERSADQGGH